MGVFRAIVEAFVLPMLHSWQQLLFRGCIAAKFISDQYSWQILTPHKPLAEELFRRLFVAPTLHQDIHNIAMLVKCTPELVPLALDGEEQLIQMPRIAGLATLPPQLVRILLPKRSAPLADRLVGKPDPTGGHELFQITIAEGESIVEPDRVTDDLGRKSIALVCGRG
jgi:hypothetical protein